VISSINSQDEIVVTLPDQSSPSWLGIRFSVLMFLNYATQGAFVPLFSVRLRELGFTPVQIGWASATSAMAALVGPLAAGQVADRFFPAQRCLTACALLAGSLLWFLSGLTDPLAVSVTTLVIWLVLGPANTLCAAMCFAHLAHPEQNFGKVRMWGTIGWVWAGWFMGFWLSRPAWLRFDSGDSNLADIFRLAGMMAFALSLYALTLPHTPPQKRGGHWLAPLVAFRLLRSRAFYTYWICSFGMCVTLPFMIQLAPLLLLQLGVPHPWLGPTMTISQSTEIFSLALLPMLFLRLSMRGTMVLGAAAWVVLLWILMLGNPLWLVIAALSMNGLFICCFIVAGQVFVNSKARGDVRASAQALLAFVNALGLLTGNLLAGWVHDQFEGEFGPTFAVAGTLAAGMAILFVVGFQQRPSGEPGA
jgi:MFS family permease